jgi:hypothetical protein
MFADYCLLFSKQKKEQATIVKSVIAMFKEGSGQLLSVNKCSILFSDNCID